MIVYIDHLVLRHLLSKTNAKPCLIRLVLLLKESDLEIKDKKGMVNLATNHLSQIENPHREPISDRALNDMFLVEYLYRVEQLNDIEPPWFANLENYLSGNILLKGLIYQ